jgi:hypothetical protein
MKYNITGVYCCIDDFCKIYEECAKHHLINSGKERHRNGRMSLSELLTIMVMFHYSPCKNFKYFYEVHLNGFHKNDFPELISYSRFVQLMPRMLVPLSILLHSLFGEETGVYIADATSIPVCHNKRISRNRVFENIAKRGKTTMGWFFGLKLHLVINHKGSIVAVKITTGNTDDRAVLDDMTQGLFGSLFGDRGYISKPLFEKLYKRGLKLITGVKRNMKNHLMPMIEKLLLRKRFVIETIFGGLKTQMNLSHTRHRSPINSFVNILSCLTAYQLKSNKPYFKFFSPLIQN